MMYHSKSRTSTKGKVKKVSTNFNTHINNLKRAAGMQERGGQKGYNEMIRAHGSKVSWQVFGLVNFDQFELSLRDFGFVANEF